MLAIPPARFIAKTTNFVEVLYSPADVLFLCTTLFFLIVRAAEAFDCTLTIHPTFSRTLLSLSLSHRIVQRGYELSGQVYEDLRALRLSLDDVAEFTGMLDEDVEDIGF